MINSYRGAVTFSTSRTHASSASGWRTVCDIVTPIRAQNKFIASGGKPLRLNAVNVYKRGSSQSLKINNYSKLKSIVEIYSYLTTFVSINFAIFRFETTVYWRFNRPYSHCTGQ
jgi:hypothetical protein